MPLQAEAVAANSEFYSRITRMIDEEKTNVNSRPSIKKHEGHASESSTSQVAICKELVGHQPRGPEKVKHAVWIWMHLYTCSLISKEI